MTQHTPGPWAVKPSASHNGFTVWTGSRDDNYISVFCSYGDGRQTEQERKVSAEADARLIAAAPDLLAALKEALHVIEHTQITDKAIARYERARAAIAKAEGTDQ